MPHFGLRAFVLLALALLTTVACPGCRSTLDHQSELLLHDSDWVQTPALIGSIPGAILGIPLWGPVALFTGTDSEASAYTLHIFVYPGALLMGGVPESIAGPSWE